VGGVAGLAAGALAMAAGEYVSVSSQADTERADLEVERREQAQDSEAEVQELAEIYIGRGVDPPLARQVAQQLMVRDALGAHARDELGISTTGQPRPLQAALQRAPMLLPLGWRNQVGDAQFILFPNGPSSRVPS